MSKIPRELLNADSSLAQQVTAFEQAMSSLNEQDQKRIMRALAVLLKGLYSSSLTLKATDVLLNDEQIQVDIRSHFKTFQAECTEVLAQHKSPKYPPELISKVMGSATLIVVSIAVITLLSVLLSFILTPPLAILVALAVGAVAGVFAGVAVSGISFGSMSFFTNNPVKQEENALKAFMKNTVDQDKSVNKKSEYTVYGDFVHSDSDTQENTCGYAPPQ